MTVRELKQLLESAKREHLEKAFIECYKQLRKTKQEEYDPLFKDILEGKEDNQKITIITDFSELEQQLTTFIKNAYESNYWTPNKIIPNYQRIKWRYMINNFIKSLEKVSVKNENYAKSVELLSDLYSMLCYSCTYHLFPVNDVFRAIGRNQPKLYETLVKRTFAIGYTRENISHLLLLATTSGVSSDCLNLSHEIVLLGELKTSDVKYIALEEAQKLVEEKEAKKPEDYDYRPYALIDDINELCNIIVLISIALAEPEDAILYYFEHFRGYDIEVTLYCILNLIDIMEEDELWIKTYEYGIREKIKPRDSLVTEYKCRKNKIAK